MAMFKPPTEDQLSDAIGLASKMDDGSDTGRHGGYGLRFVDSNQPKDFVKFFVPDPDFFAPINKPEAKDWLANHSVTGQSFEDFIKARRIFPDNEKHTIYLQPLVFFEEPVPPDILDSLSNYAGIFFGMTVVLNPEINLKGQIPHRLNDFSNTLQVNAKYVLNRLTDMIPANAFCLAGVTLCDLYPEDEWNFVFGLASFTKRCGIYSLARYMDNFGEHMTSVLDKNVDSVPTVLRRACKTMCHEIGHMFSLQHCVYFKCLMNGSNHLQEADSRPSFLCPVCLRKLQYSCHFDILERYRKMHEFHLRHGLTEEVNWLKRRIEFLLR